MWFQEFVDLGKLSNSRSIKFNINFRYVLATLASCQPERWLTVYCWPFTNFVTCDMVRFELSLHPTSPWSFSVITSVYWDHVSLRFITAVRSRAHTTPIWSLCEGAGVGSQSISLSQFLMYSSLLGFSQRCGADLSPWDYKNVWWVSGDFRVVGWPFGVMRKLVNHSQKHFEGSLLENESSQRREILIAKNNTGQTNIFCAFLLNYGSRIPYRSVWSL